MIWFKSVSFAIFVVVLVAGCASRVNVDYDKSINFTELRSYRGLAKSDKSTTDTRLNSPLIDKRITMALKERLAAKGFSEGEGQGDFSVAYQINLKHEITSDNSGVSMMFGTGIGRRSGFGLGYSVPAMAVESEERCMLTIDIINSVTGDLIWRGISTRRMTEGVSTAEADAFFKGMVAEILARFPPP